MRALTAALVALVVTACAVAGPASSTTSAPPPTTAKLTVESPAGSTTPSPPATTTSTPAASTSTPTATTLPEGVILAPDWLGTRPLDEDDAPFETPPELSDRRFASPDHLPAPPDDRFQAAVSEVPDGVLARATWSEECPVGLEDLAYLTVTFHGFDQRAHTGELIVHADVASDIVEVFSTLYDARFPIEEMRVTSQADLGAAPTGDGNSTAAFVCRPVTGGTSWSEHAYGLAIDINPFHNPYVQGDLVLPELATDYTDRQRLLPGMISEGDVVVEAFEAIGWEWGGRWSSLKDYQHFSWRGR